MDALAPPSGFFLTSFKQYRVARSNCQLRQATNRLSLAGVSRIVSLIAVIAYTNTFTESV